MELTIEQNQAQHRFETTVDGHTAFIVYARFPGGIAYIHTEVPPELEGKGIASQMAKYVLDYARTNNLKVRPLCPYVNAYMKRHPEYNDLLEQ
ncbi:GNAT family N-acetyltransferase [Chitinophaga solisilvae]|uniref:N-acetyltransferase n=1 Tax=Chitinophaga solisilvae TaxID=1233460 RepID=A0A433WPA2_9BACT|nr:GNAT family N-acetyltransferase [Chitinophaga solisilvae]NSL86485.1 N-acetyltransferase [Chitinophaga solisilvae]